MKWGGEKRGEHARQRSFLEYKIFNDGGIVFQFPSIGKNIQLDGVMQNHKLHIKPSTMSSLGGFWGCIFGFVL